MSTPSLCPLVEHGWLYLYQLYPSPLLDHQAARPQSQQFSESALFLISFNVIPHVHLVTLISVASSPDASLRQVNSHTRICCRLMTVFGRLLLYIFSLTDYTIHTVIHTVITSSIAARSLWNLIHTELAMCLRNAPWVVCAPLKPFTVGFL